MGLSEQFEEQRTNQNLLDTAMVKIQREFNKPDADIKIIISLNGEIRNRVLLDQKLRIELDDEKD